MSLAGALGVLAFLTTAVMDPTYYHLDSIGTVTPFSEYLYSPYKPHQLSPVDIYVNPWLGALCALPFVLAKPSRDLLLLAWRR